MRPREGTIKRKINDYIKNSKVFGITRYNIGRI